MDELLEQFVIEGRELVQQAVDGLLVLERAGYEAEAIDSLFRAVHTLKGSAGLFDAAPLASLLHVAEDAIAAARDGRRAPGPEALDLLVDCCGQIEIWIEAMAATERLPGDAAERSLTLVSSLQAAIEGAAEHPKSAPDPAGDMPDWMRELLAADRQKQALTAVRYEPAAGCFFVGDDPLELLRSVPSLVVVRIERREPWSLADYDPFSCNLILVALSAAPPETVRGLFRFVPDQAVVLPTPAGRNAGAALPEVVSAKAPGRATEARIVRVEEERIDDVAELVNELFAAKSRLSTTIARAATVAPHLADEIRRAKPSSTGW